MTRDPTPGDLVIASLSQAKRHKRRFDAVITLEDPGCRPAHRLRFARRPAPPHLVLAFEDVDDDTLGIRVATLQQVEEALKFARRHADGSLLVHCFHGVGRSTAIALSVLADRLGAGAESQAMDRLLLLRPTATPNLVVVKLADQALGRGGRLIAALAAWEQTAPGMAEVREARLKFLKNNPRSYTWA